MNKRKCIEIASRIYGLYLLFQVPLALSVVMSVFSIDPGQIVKNPGLYRAWAVIYPIITLATGIFLIIKAEFISKIVAGKPKSDIEKENHSQAHMRLSFWITLLGIYFFIESSSSFIRDIIRHPPQWGDSYALSIILSHGIVFIASVFMIFRSDGIEQLLLMKTKGRS